MLDRSKVWTGDLNRRALEPQPHVTVGLYDTTLRDGEQTVGVVLSPEDKVAIAKALDEAGIDRIEAGFPRVSEEDAEAIRLIMQEDSASRGLGLRARRARGRRGAGGARASAPRWSRARSRTPSSRRSASRARRCSTASGRPSRAASAAGVTVAYFGVDGTRADLGFVREAYEAAVEAGAREVVVVDTLGVATPEAAAFLVGSVVEWLGDAIPVHWHGHDDFGLATAAAVAAVQAGATWVQGTVNGMGERGGNANLLEVALALEALYAIPTRLRLERARALGRLRGRTAGTPLEPWKPVTGENLFTRESGAVARSSTIRRRSSRTPRELVGAQRGIVLGKKSGLDSIRIKVEQLGLDLPEERYADVLAKVKALGVRKGGLVTDAEFRRLGERRRHVPPP